MGTAGCDTGRGGLVTGFVTVGAAGVGKATGGGAATTGGLTGGATGTTAGAGCVTGTVAAGAAVGAWTAGTCGWFCAEDLPPPR
ncbi:hypothetical protein [Limnohabitans parvus]|uniref:hypothetical protein n=1 Tax=Limnohabitans parvus TaxID=540061 RepID=UPI00197C3D7C|nr:hypothetical protein [Limnohabitans parvus]